MFNDGFAKIECGILDSSLWRLNPERILFLTALLMAKPYELEEPIAQLAVKTMQPTGWTVPAGWYGLVRAAAPAIFDRAKIGESPEALAAALDALERLGEPEIESRSQEYEGRRLVRVNGGFLVLNFMRVRDNHQEANAERQRRYRQRRKAKQGVTGNVTNNGVTSRVTHAEAEAEAEAKNPIDLIHQGSGENGSTEMRVSETREVRRVRRPKTVEQFIAQAASIGIPEQDLRDQFELWSIAEWHNGFGQEIFDWKRALVSLKQKNLLPSQVRREPETSLGNSSPAAFQPTREWIIEHFRTKTRGMNYMPISRYCHEKLVDRGYVWHKQAIRDEEHAKAVLSDIAEEYARRA